MATVKLNLAVNKDVAENIKKYANGRNISVSHIAESFFMAITAPVAAKEKAISSLVKSFSIDNVSVPDDFDYKQALANARDEKYL